MTEWDYESVTNRLDENYRKGRDGIPEIIAILEYALARQADSTSLSLVGNAVHYLSKLIDDGHKTKEIGCVLVKTIRQQEDFGASLDTAVALKKITGVDVGYDKGFVDKFDPDSARDLLSRVKMIEIWQRELGCEAEK